VGHAEAFLWDTLRRSKRREDDLVKSVEERVNGHNMLVCVEEEGRKVLARDETRGERGEADNGRRGASCSYCGVHGEGGDERVRVQFADDAGGEHGAAVGVCVCAESEETVGDGEGDVGRDHGRESTLVRKQASGLQRASMEGMEESFWPLLFTPPPPLLTPCFLA